MTWFFEGTGTQLSFSISISGKLTAHGTCSQFCRPESGDASIFRHVEGIPGTWSLHSSDAAEHEYDEGYRGLKSSFEENGGRAAALIYYNAADNQDPAFVGASILMSPR